jgi:hypothetical protein
MRFYFSLIVAKIRMNVGKRCDRRYISGRARRLLRAAPRPKLVYVVRRAGRRAGGAQDKGREGI